MPVANARYEDGHDNLEPIEQVSCGITAGIVADTRLRSVGVSGSVGDLCGLCDAWCLLGAARGHKIPYIPSPLVFW